MPRTLLIILYFVLASVLSGVAFIGGSVAFSKIIRQAEIAGLGLILLLLWLSIIIGFVSAYFLLLKKFRSSTVSPSPFWLSFVLHLLIVLVGSVLLAPFPGYMPAEQYTGPVFGALLLAGLVYLVGRTMIRVEGSFIGALGLALFGSFIVVLIFRQPTFAADISLVLSLVMGLPVLLGTSGYYLAKRFWPKLI